MRLSEPIEKVRRKLDKTELWSTAHHLYKLAITGKHSSFMDELLTLEDKERKFVLLQVLNELKANSKDGIVSATNLAEQVLELAHDVQEFDRISSIEDEYERYVQECVYLGDKPKTVHEWRLDSIAGKPDDVR